MPNYLRPDVYFEETLRPLSDVSSSPSDSAAAFIGTARSGPKGPVRVTSWAQFQALYGNVSYETGDLHYAVFNFFSNGGGGAYIVRAIPADSIAAQVMLYDGDGTDTANEVLKVEATAPGGWASDADSSSRIFVTVRPGVGGRFDLVVDVGSTNYLAATETFVDLSMDPGDTRYAPNVVNSPTVGSRYVKATHSANNTTNAGPGAASKVPMTGGVDGTDPVDLAGHAQALEQVPRNLVVNLPGADVTVVGEVVEWAAETGNHFVVADVPEPADGETDSASVTSMTAYAAALPQSSVVAVYGPWYWANDPGSASGSMRLTAPGGAVVAQMLRTDATRGVHKAPAGVATNISGAMQPLFLYTHEQKDTLAQSNINLLMPIPGAGLVIWGARTQATTSLDRYVPVRRLLLALKADLTSVTRFAAFENNDDDLRETVAATVERYLNTRLSVGALKGDSAGEAFFVRCDETNNPPAVVESGTLVIDVGVALKTPAEFILIRIGQQQAGTTATDSLEDI